MITQGSHFVPECSLYTWTPMSREPSGRSFPSQSHFAVLLCFKRCCVSCGFCNCAPTSFLWVSQWGLAPKSAGMWKVSMGRERVFLACLQKSLAHFSVMLSMGSIVAELNIFCQFLYIFNNIKNHSLYVFNIQILFHISGIPLRALLSSLTHKGGGVCRSQVWKA